MQTEAEKYLIKILRQILSQATALGKILKLINLGAAKSTVVEEELLEKKGEEIAVKAEDFFCDRCDIQDCDVNKPYVNRTYICSLEDMSVINDNSYDLAFANFVMEHVLDAKKVAAEMARIVKLNGQLVLSMSNPLSPEFLFAKITPTKFHQLFRAKGHDEAYPVKYSYQSIPRFIQIMKAAGWELVEAKYLPATYSYLHRFPGFNILSLMYDKMLILLNIKAMMGHTVLHWRLIDKN